MQLSHTLSNDTFALYCTRACIQISVHHEFMIFPSACYSSLCWRHYKEVSYMVNITWLNRGRVKMIENDWKWLTLLRGSEVSVARRIGTRLVVKLAWTCNLRQSIGWLECVLIIAAMYECLNILLTFLRNIGCISMNRWRINLVGIIIRANLIPLVLFMHC